jgi:hypothetical protein
MNRMWHTERDLGTGMAWHGRCSLLELAGNKGRETNCRVANETSEPILVATSAQPLLGGIRCAAADGRALVLECRVHRYKRRASNHIVSQERNSPSSDVRGENNVNQSDNGHWPRTVNKGSLTSHFDLQLQLRLIPRKGHVGKTYAQW